MSTLKPSKNSGQMGGEKRTFLNFLYIATIHEQTKIGAHCKIALFRGGGVKIGTVRIKYGQLAGIIIRQKGKWGNVIGAQRGSR